MNFDFSQEQVMLRDSVARFLQEEYDFDSRREAAASELGYSRDRWQSFADLGWLSVPFAEEFGGFGGGPVDTMLVLEEFGKGLVLEPYLATVLLFGGLLQKCGIPEQQSALIPRLIQGEIQGAFAYLERQSRFELTDVKTSARVEGDAWRLQGEKVMVYNGVAADHFVILARTSGEQSDARGLSLFLVAADSPGLTCKSYRLMDGQAVANIVLDGVLVPKANLIGEPENAITLVEEVVCDANIALAAEAVGIMAELNRKTLEYTLTREQFGVPIGSFQALQHRMVDTFMALEQCRSLLYRAVCDRLAGSNEANATVHALMVMVDRSGRQIGGEAIQLHGGMGITDELDIGHYVKRLMMINSTFGNGDYHQEKFNDLRYKEAV